MVPLEDKFEKSQTPSDQIPDRNFLNCVSDVFDQGCLKQLVFRKTKVSFFPAKASIYVRFNFAITPHSCLLLKWANVQEMGKWKSDIEVIKLPDVFNLWWDEIF